MLRQARISGAAAAAGTIAPHVGQAGRPLTGDARAKASPSVRAIRSMAGRALDGVRGWYRKRATRRELAALSDQHLKDIGLERPRIASTVDDYLRAGGRLG